MVHPATDIWHKFSWREQGRALDAKDFNDVFASRFARLFPASTPIFMDKSPENVFRLGLLDALDPSSKFVHLVRDARPVAASISKLADTSFPITRSHDYNFWWGVDGAKWHFLQRVSEDSPFLSAVTMQNLTNYERGVCEWILSLQEVQKHKDILGDRIIHVQYADLVGDPERILQLLAEFLGLPADGGWLLDCIAQIRPPTSDGVEHPPLSDDLLAEIGVLSSAYGLHPTH
jgi:hypothetical protein